MLSYAFGPEELKLHVAGCIIKAFKVEEGEPVTEKTKFGWTVHRGTEGIVNMCMFINNENECKKLYSWDVLGLQDDIEHSQAKVHDEFNERFYEDQRR